MARFAFESSFAPLSAGHVRMRPLKEGPKDAGRHRRQTIRVPAGKTKLVILDDAPLSSLTDARALRLVSNVEDVKWWPIDSATPALDEDTREFGFLFDLSAATFEHAHGVRSDQYQSGGVDVHTAAGLEPGYTMYSTLPTWFSNAFDRTSPPTVGSPRSFFTDRRAAQFNVGQGGYVREASTEAVDGSSKLAYYLIGKDDYYNLGTADDGLEFILYVYVGDNLKCPTMGAGFMCYPYSVSLLDPDDVPTAHPATGQTIWSTGDAQLDTVARVSPAAGPRGFLNAPGAFFSVAGRSIAQDGWQAMRFQKIDFSLNTDGIINSGANPTWNRITMMYLQFSTAAVGGDDTPVYIGNLYFGPRAGRLRALRPYEHCTDRPWSASSVPAIGIQNATETDAEVEVEYWGI